MLKCHALIRPTRFSGCLNEGNSLHSNTHPPREDQMAIMETQHSQKVSGYLALRIVHVFSSENNTLWIYE